MTDSLSYSIIIPVHNGARTLSRCLASLAQQKGTERACDVIVVDDASTDGTAEIARAHDVRLISLLQRSGPGAARNAGAAQAQGEVLLFMDADCEAAPDWCQEMLRAFAEAEVCGVYGAYRSRQTGAVARLAQAEFDERYARLAQRESIDFLGTHAAAIRRRVFEQVGGFRSDLRGNEDVELAFRLSRLGYRLVFAPQAVVYHEHAATWGAYLRTKVSRGYWRTLAYAAHPSKALADAYTPPWLKLQVILMGAVAGLLVLSAVHGAFLPLLVLALLALLVTTLPFTLFVARMQPDLALLAPWFALGRSAALAVGAAGGVVELALRRTGTSP